VLLAQYCDAKLLVEQQLILELLVCTIDFAAIGDAFNSRCANKFVSCKSASDEPAPQRPVFIYLLRALNSEQSPSSRVSFSLAKVDWFCRKTIFVACLARGEF
jgi:hypothetical protein